jgi:hypothetical protein
MGGRGPIHRYDPGLLRGILTSDYQPKPRKHRVDAHVCLTPFGKLNLAICPLLNDDELTAA